MIFEMARKHLKTNFFFLLSDSLHSSLSQYIQEHYPSEVGFGVFPQPDSTIAIVIVDSRYSPQNFWNGRWRSWYLLDPASGRISGSIEIDVHYFEDGNVRLKTRKEIGVVDAKSPLIVVNRIAQAESKYQEDVNRAFVGLNENEFKALRRQLPVTRSKMNWGKAIGTYRLGKGEYIIYIFKHTLEMQLQCALLTYTKR